MKTSRRRRTSCVIGSSTRVYVSPSSANARTCQKREVVAARGAAAACLQGRRGSRRDLPAVASLGSGAPQASQASIKRWPSEGELLDLWRIGAVRGAPTRSRERLWRRSSSPRQVPAPARDRSLCGTCSDVVRIEKSQKGASSSCVLQRAGDDKGGRCPRPCSSCLSITSARPVRHVVSQRGKFLREALRRTQRVSQGACLLLLVVSRSSLMRKPCHDHHRQAQPMEPGDPKLPKADIALCRLHSAQQ